MAEAQKKDVTKSSLSLLNGFCFFLAENLPAGTPLQERCFFRLFQSTKALAKKEPEKGLYEAVSLLPLASRETGQRDLAVVEVLDMATAFGKTNPSSALRALDFIGFAQPKSTRVRNLFMATRQKLWQKNQQDNFTFS